MIVVGMYRVDGGVCQNPLSLQYYFCTVVSSSSSRTTDQMGCCWGWHVARTVRMQHYTLCTVRRQGVRSRARMKGQESRELRTVHASLPTPVLIRLMRRLSLPMGLSNRLGKCCVRTTIEERAHHTPETSAVHSHASIGRPHQTQDSNRLFSSK